MEERARVVEERVRVAMGWEEAVTALGVEARARAVAARAVAEMARAVVAWAVAARVEEGMASGVEATGWAVAAKATVVVATARAEAVTETVAAAMGGAGAMGTVAEGKVEGAEVALKVPVRGVAEEEVPAEAVRAPETEVTEQVAVASEAAGSGALLVGEAAAAAVRSMNRSRRPACTCRSCSSTASRRCRRRTARTWQRTPLRRCGGSPSRR